MVKEQKVERVKQLETLFSDASSLILAEYRGLSVSQQMKLRRELKNVGASFNVVKMSLAKRAAENIGFKNIVDYLNGPTGVAVIDSDPVEAAKVLKTFSKEHDSFVIKGGMMEGEDLTLDKFEILATIDSRDVLLAKLAGGFIAPLNKFFGVGKALLSKPAYALQALLEQKKLNDDQTNNEEE
jgi:large subunit ribosomal protein L10